MLLTHPYTLGLLYHIVLTGSEDRKTYRKAVELLCKELRSKGMPCRYKACYEKDKFKRFHKHVFLLIEAKDFHPDTIIHYRKGHWFTEMLAGLKLGFKIAPPQDSMHQVAGKQVNYAYVPKKAGAKLDDCLVWISYLTKVRSKAGVEGQVYTGSTNREGKPFPPSAALPAEKETIAAKAIQNDSKLLQGDSKPSVWVDTKSTPESHQEAVFASQTHNDNKEANENSTTTQYQTNRQGKACNSSPSEARCNASLVGSRSSRNASTEASSSPGKASNPRYEDGSGASTHHREGQYEMKWTPAETYVATQYEAAVDQQLDIDALRLFLLEHGIKRTPAQVAWELEEKYGFLGYVSRNPAPAKADTRALDALIDRTPLRSVRAKVLGNNAPRFWGNYSDSLGRSKPCYYLPKREAELGASLIVRRVG